MADKGFGEPDFGDAIGPKGWGGPQGDCASVNYVDEYSYGNAVRPAARMDQNSIAGPAAESSHLRGYHTAGIGGSANPNALGAKGNPGTERSGQS